MSYIDYIAEKKKNKAIGNDNYTDIFMELFFCMFDYKKLDKVLYKKTLETALRVGGYAVTTELEGELATMPAIPSELPDNNGRYIKFKAFTRNGKNVKVTRDVDCVVWENNTLCRGENSLEWYANILAELDKSMEVLVRFSRAQPIPLAKDNTQLESIRTVQKANEEGRLDAVLDSGTFDELIEGTSVKQDRVINFTDPSLTEKFQALSRFHDDLIRRWASMYGHDLNGSPKSAQQSVEEIQGGESLSLTMCLDNYKKRKEAVDAIVEMYGDKYDLEGASVEFSETWIKQIANFMIADDVAIDQDIVNVEEMEVSDNGEERDLDE